MGRVFILFLLSDSQALLNIYTRNLTAVSLHLLIIDNIVPLTTETFLKVVQGKAHYFNTANPFM